MHVALAAIQIHARLVPQLALHRGGSRRVTRCPGERSTLLLAPPLPLAMSGGLPSPPMRPIPEEAVTPSLDPHFFRPLPVVSPELQGLTPDDVNALHDARQRAALAESALRQERAAAQRGHAALASMLQGLESVLAELASAPMPVDDDLESRASAAAAKDALERRRLQLEHLGIRMSKAMGVDEPSGVSEAEARAVSPSWNAEVAALTVVAAVDAASQAWRGWAAECRRCANRWHKAAAMDRATEIHARAWSSELKENEVSERMTEERSRREAALVLRVRSLRDRLLGAPDGAPLRLLSPSQRPGPHYEPTSPRSHPSRLPRRASSPAGYPHSPAAILRSASSPRTPPRSPSPLGTPPSTRAPLAASPLSHARPAAAGLPLMLRLPRRWY